MPPWLPPLTSFCLTAAALWALLRSRLAHGLAMDHPNERSLHAVAVPRIGGAVAVPSAVAAMLLAGVPPLLPVVALLLCGLSFLDDRKGLPVAIRFGAHLAAACIAVLVGFGGANVAAILAATIAVAWMTNLYNFMDGANGLAGGMAVFGFGAMGFAAEGAGASDLAVICFALAASAIGFLLFNFHPARVFLGDAGSIPLGFLAGALGIAGTTRGTWPLWFPGLVFSPFIVDATVTLLKRALRGEKVWQAHREHYYQRLIRLGWSHRRLALAEYALMLAAALLGLAIATDVGPSPELGLAAWTLFLVILMAAIDARWRAAARRGSPA